jgi:hypothetical protein
VFFAFLFTRCDANSTADNHNKHSTFFSFSDAYRIWEKKIVALHRIYISCHTVILFYDEPYFKLDLSFLQGTAWNQTQIFPVTFTADHPLPNFIDM